MRRVLIATLVLVALGVLPAFAQGDRGQIAGFIKDQTGRMIRGATVTATNGQTRLTWTAVTDTRGYYVFPALPPGPYELLGGAAGFQAVGADRDHPGCIVQRHEGRDAQSRRAHRNRSR